MNNWWAAEFWEADRVLLISWVFWVIFSIVLHELGHGWAALRAGDPTPRETGHMTWNPVVHMGVPSLVVFALAGIAWGQMPVNPQRFKGRYDDAIVAAAGPAMNFGLAVLCHVLLGVWVAAAGGYWWSGVSVPDEPFRNFQVFLRVGGVLNLVLIGLNLLPVPPLDGSRIIASFIPSYGRLWESDGSRVAAMFLLIAALFYGSAKLFDAAFVASRFTEGAVLSVFAPEAA